MLEDHKVKIDQHGFLLSNIKCMLTRYSISLYAVIGVRVVTV